MLKIYGADLSAYSNKVRFLANALELTYEYHYVSIKNGQNREEEFLRLNPFGKIPVMDDDGFVLFESGAIIKYLARKTKSSFYPDDLEQRALVDQWMSFSSFHIGGAMGKILFNRIFAPLNRIPIDERALKEGRAFLDRYFPVLEAQLGRRQFLAIDQLTLGDFTLLSALDPAEIAEIDLTGYPRLLRWREQLRTKDWYTRCHKKYGERLESILNRQEL